MIVVVDGHPSAMARRHAEALVAWVDDDGRHPQVVVWGEPGPDRSPLCDRPGAFVVADLRRKLSATPLGRSYAVTQGMLRAGIHLRLNRAAGRAGVPCYLDGADAIHALPWLPDRIGPILWHVQADERVPGIDPGTVPRLDRVVVTDADQAERARAVGVAPSAITPVAPHLPRPARAPHRTPGLTVGVVGPATWEHGADLAHRLAAALRSAASPAPVRLRWLGAGTTAPPLAVTIDAAALDPQGTVTFEAATPPLEQAMPTFDVLAVLSRHPGDAVVVLEALAAGTPVVGWDGPTTDGLDRWFPAPALTTARFPDVDDLARAVLGRIDRADPSPAQAHGSAVTRDLLGAWAR